MLSVNDNTAVAAGAAFETITIKEPITMHELNLDTLLNTPDEELAGKVFGSTVRSPERSGHRPDDDDEAVTQVDDTPVLNGTVMGSPVGGPADLTGLAQEINSAHKEMQHHATGMLLAAKRAGEALLKAKEEVSDFKAWIATNTSISRRQAYRYIDVAENWDVVACATRDTPDLSLRGALKVIGKGVEKPKSTAPAPPSAPENQDPAPAADALVADKKSAPDAGTGEAAESSAPLRAPDGAPAVAETNPEASWKFTLFSARFSEIETQRIRELHDVATVSTGDKAAAAQATLKSFAQQYGMTIEEVLAVVNTKDSPEVVLKANWERKRREEEEEQRRLLEEEDFDYDEEEEDDDPTPEELTKDDAKYILALNDTILKGTPRDASAAKDKLKRFVRRFGLSSKNAVPFAEAVQLACDFNWLHAEKFQELRASGKWDDINDYAREFNMTGEEAIAKADEILPDDGLTRKEREGQRRQRILDEVKAHFKGMSKEKMMLDMADRIARGYDPL